MTNVSFSNRLDHDVLLLPYGTPAKPGGYISCRHKAPDGTQCGGVNMSEIQIRLLQKIKELMLYVIGQDKE